MSSLSEFKEVVSDLEAEGQGPTKDLPPAADENFDDVFDLESIIPQLTEELRIKDQELLTSYVRQVATVLIESGLTKPAKSLDELTYRMGGTLNPTIKAVLELVPKTQQDTCLAVSFGGGEYNGMPNNTGKITDPDDLPPLVRRWQVTVQDLKMVGQGKPIQGQRKSKVIANPKTRLDIELG